MAEKKFYWLKLKEDFFESKRIKKLRKLAGGDTMTIIYLKMQLKSINNDGYLSFSGLEKTFAEELALDIDENPEDVGLLLNYLVAVGLIETSDNVNFLLPYARECIGSETASAQRKRDQRQRERDIVTLVSQDSPKLSQSCHTEKEIEKEKDIDIDTLSDMPYVVRIVRYLNSKANKQYKATSKKTRSLINARLKEGFTVEDFMRVIDNKVADWKPRKDMEIYLRPETLFGPKFEGYLNENRGEGEKRTVRRLGERD